MSSVPGQPGQPAQPAPLRNQAPRATRSACAARAVGAPKATGGAVPPAAPGQIPPGYEPKTPWTAYIKPVIWTIVAVYVIAFVFLNKNSIAINFIFFQAEVPLIFVLVGMALIGAGLCAGVMVMTRRRAAKKAELAAAKPKLADGKKSSSISRQTCMT